MATKTLFEIEVVVKGTAWYEVWAKTEDEAKDLVLNAAFGGGTADLMSEEIHEAEVVDIREGFDQDDGYDDDEDYVDDYDPGYWRD